jgi:hypothetical protein
VTLTYHLGALNGKCELCKVFQKGELCQVNILSELCQVNKKLDKVFVSCYTLLFQVGELCQVISRGVMSSIYGVFSLVTIVRVRYNPRIHDIIEEPF